MKELFLILVVLAAVVDGIWWGVRHDLKAQDEFMHACMKDHKDYECVALWRSGDNRTTIVPVILPK